MAPNNRFGDFLKLKFSKQLFIPDLRLVNWEVVFDWGSADGALLDVDGAVRTGDEVTARHEHDVALVDEADSASALVFQLLVLFQKLFGAQTLNLGARACRCTRLFLLESNLQNFFFLCQ